MGTPGVVLTVVIVAAFAGSPWLLSLIVGTRGRRWRGRVKGRLPHRDRGPVPVNRPIEAIALDVRLRGAKFHALPPHAPYVKQTALASAYDLVLAECCVSLGQAHLLAVLRPGPELERERRRVELLLHSFGLPVDHAA